VVAEKIVYLGAKNGKKNVKGLFFSFLDFCGFKEGENLRKCFTKKI